MPGVIKGDCCHLNGLAVADGQPMYVTAVAATTTPKGWREHRADGGVLMRVADHEIVARGLSMPHSPRLQGDRLWLLNSGTGSLGYVEPDSGRFVETTFLPGFARGLEIVGQYAVVGISKPREARVFQGLPLDDLLRRHGIPEAACGLCVVDLTSGRIVHDLVVEGHFDEIQDLAVIRGKTAPIPVGLRMAEVGKVVTIAPRRQAVTRG